MSLQRKKPANTAKHVLAWQLLMAWRGSTAADAGRELEVAMNRMDRHCSAIKTTRRESGFSMLQLIIVLAVVGIVSTVALISFRRSKDSIALQNSVRLLAARAEKARVDAVRRHGTANVQFTSTSAYTVNMDFNNNGAPITRSYSFEPGVRIASAELPNVTFNWRGATVTAGTTCVVTFSVVNGRGDNLNVDVSGAGDITVENNQPVLPTISYSSSINSNANIRTPAAITGTTVADNTPCMDVSGVGVGGDSGPPSCNLHISSTTVSVRKNGGSTASVVISLSTPSMVATAYPGNLLVSPGSQNVSSGSTFSIASKNNLRGPFDVTFSSACGSSITLRVNVTN
jgi:type II secretory pathway pseudopilin PulG